MFPFCVDACLAITYGCAAPEKHADGRAAAVLFDAFETVFYADASLMATSGNQDRVPPESRTLLQPFRYFRAGLGWLGDQVLTDVLAASDGVMVGAKDFRPPNGLGPVRSTRCFVAMLTSGNALDFKRHFKYTPVAFAAGAPVWNWAANLGEFGEGDPKRSSLYAAMIGNSYVLVSNSLPEIRSVADKLTAPGDRTSLTGIRDWAALRRHEEWGYRRYRHDGVADRSASGMRDVAPDAEALTFYVDLQTRVGVLRLHGSADDTRAEQPIGGTLFPPLKAAGRGVWEVVVPLDRKDTSPDQCFIVVGLFGLATYL